MIPFQHDTKDHPQPPAWGPAARAHGEDLHCSPQVSVCTAVFSQPFLHFTSSLPLPHHFLPLFSLLKFIISLTSMPLLLSALSLYLLALWHCLFSYNNCTIRRKSKKSNRDAIFCMPIPLALLYFCRAAFTANPPFVLAAFCRTPDLIFFWAMHNMGRLRFCLWPLGATVIQIISLRSRHVLIHAVYGTGLLQLE